MTPFEKTSRDQGGFFIDNWRTATGIEVDFVIVMSKRRLPVEINTAARVTTADARGHEAFHDGYSDLADGALLLHGVSGILIRCR